MKNKGVTLVELLAVIVVLAIIVLLIVPQVNSTINKARMKTIEASALTLAKNGQSMWDSSNVFSEQLDSIPCKEIGKINDQYGVCGVTFNEEGKATVTLRGKNGGKFDGIVCHGTEDDMKCTRVEPKRCTSNSDTEYDDGTYIYRYKQQKTKDDWEAIEQDGWGVVLKDKDYTGTITEAPCSYINDKPIVSMQMTFRDSKAKVIDLTNFDTSNVVSMRSMFIDSYVEKIKGLNYIDTSNVENMKFMFAGNTGITKVKELDLSGFNTSKVTDMTAMFQYCGAEKIIGLTSFDTSNVTNMSYMFGNSQVKELDLTNFDTSNVTTMEGMFMNSQAVEIKGLENWDTSKVENMHMMFAVGGTEFATLGYSKVKELDLSNFDSTSLKTTQAMFQYCGAEKIIFGPKFTTKEVTTMQNMFNTSQVKELDLSNFDTSKVTNKSYMFENAATSKVYVKDNDAVTWFSTGTSKPSTMSIVVK